MTDESNLPAVPQAPTREVATLDTDSWVEVAKPIFALASRIFDTEFVPKGLRGSEPATAAAMLYGREIGLPPMTSLGGIHVIEGKPGLSAEQMRAMVFAAGHEIEFVESTGATCTIRGKRRGQERWTPVTWTIDMARAAGIGNKPIWKNYPRTQLQARCTTELCRMIFPDVIHGFRSVEELEDMSDDDAAAGGAPASGSSKVSRRRTAKRAASGNDTARGETSTAKGSQPAPVDPVVPPLPGEPGYDLETAGEGNADSSTVDRDAVDTGEDATPSPAPEGPGVEQSAPDPSPETPEGEVSSGQSSPAQAVERATPPPPARPRKLSRAQQRMLMAEFGGFGMSGDDEREERLLVATTILGREVETTNDLSTDEASTLIDTLAKVKDRQALNRLLDEYDAAEAAQAEQDDES